ncbi:hypothetical protein QAD02_003617 [Eretmocerus hayati]|uniref:Uncharacterized protein n=1 Tax=Eretmocerus hayati TaxID=131215 RepID=A0ACC2NNB0_9HYME|nr:hypothetical protein QAD02_003617 [Eretmocerus hayati]
MFVPRESTTHLVVIFLDYTRPDGQKAVELVPVGWWHQVSGVDFCSYPPDRDTHHVPKWVEGEKSPEDGWIAWKVKVIKQAKNHEQGLRRLKKSYTQEEFSSSADEVAAEIPVTESDIPILNDDQISDELMDISLLSDEDNDDTREERLPSSNSRSVSRPNTSNEPSVLPDRSPSETLAALNRVRSNSKKRPATVEDLENFEKRIKSQIKSELKSFRRSTQYDMNEFLREAASRVVLAKFSSETEKTIITRTSRWFSGSGDREGDRKLRSGGRPDTSSTSGSNENSAGSVNDSNDF